MPYRFVPDGINFDGDYNSRWVGVVVVVVVVDVVICLCVPTFFHVSRLDNF